MQYTSRILLFSKPIILFYSMQTLFYSQENSVLHILKRNDLSQALKGHLIIDQYLSVLNLIWTGSLEARLRWGVNYSPCLKLVRIMLETLNLLCKYTHICSFRKYAFQYQGILIFAYISIFFCKKLSFFGKNSTFTQSNSVRAVLEIFQFCFPFS